MYGVYDIMASVASSHVVCRVVCAVGFAARGACDNELRPTYVYHVCKTYSNITRANHAIFEVKEDSSQKLEAVACKIRVRVLGFCHLYICSRVLGL